MKKDEPGYFPRRLNIVVPLGESVHQFIIQGKDQVGALAKVTDVMARHKANLLAGGTYDSDRKGEFLFDVFAELASADCSAEILASELKSLPFVTRVSFSNAEEAIYDPVLFPVVLFGENRAAIQTAQSIAFIEQNLQKQIGKQGLQVLFEVGRSSAISLAELHKNMLPDADREELLKTAVDDMRARGWGLVSFQVSKTASGKTAVTVSEPIFAGIPDVQNSWWLMGLASGFLEAIYGYRTVVSGTPTYDAETRVYRFELVEFSPDARTNRDLV